MYNFRLNRWHVNLKLINDLNIYVKKYGLLIIFNYNFKLCPIPSAVAGFRFTFVANIVVCKFREEMGVRGLVYSVKTL